MRVILVYCHSSGAIEVQLLRSDREQNLAGCRDLTDPVEATEACSKQMLINGDNVGLILANDAL